MAHYELIVLVVDIMSSTTLLCVLVGDSFGGFWLGLIMSTNLNGVLFGDDFGGWNRWVIMSY